MAWTFDAPLCDLERYPHRRTGGEALGSGILGGLTEDNNPIPVPVVWLVL